jgi:hypothetical protein
MCNPSYRSSEYYCSFFKYNTEDEFDRVGELFEDFVDQKLSENDDVMIGIHGWNNKCFYSFQ